MIFVCVYEQIYACIGAGHSQSQVVNMESQHALGLSVCIVLLQVGICVLTMLFCAHICTFYQQAFTCTFLSWCVRIQVQAVCEDTCSGGAGLVKMKLQS